MKKITYGIAKETRWVKKNKTTENTEGTQRKIEIVFFYHLLLMSLRAKRSNPRVFEIAARLCLLQWL